MTLEKSDGYELVLPVNDLQISGPVRKFTVAKENSNSVWFPVRLTRVGDVNIAVKAESSIAADALVRTIYVRVRSRSFARSLFVMNKLCCP